MAYPLNRIILILLIIFIGTGCANIVPPVGGKRDVKPPKLVQASPPDSQLNIRPKRVELRFDEYVTVTDATKEVHISPTLPVAPTATGIYKKVTVRIADTMLEPSTTYRITFGKAIADLHEGNVFSNYTYTFSTGGYFDSLELRGMVINAVTGLPDSGSVLVLLYSAKESDSAVVKKKPLYITSADKSGLFSFKGLPGRSFCIYALKDRNDNLIYDGGDEWIGFIDKIVLPGDTDITPIQLRIFKEEADSSKIKQDTLGKKLLSVAAGKASKTAPAFDYTVDVDTTDVKRRTKEINKPCYVLFNRKIASFNRDRISLSYDSEGVTIPAKFTLQLENSAAKDSLGINANWRESTTYTLKLLKGFAKDTLGADAMPSKYAFTTKMEDDYGKLIIHVPPQYLSIQYVLLVKTDNDTIYRETPNDTLMHLNLLPPAIYTVTIIIDKNENGKWDTGDLFKKLQPEEVIPYGNPITVKPGWENTIDMPDNSKIPSAADHSDTHNQKPK